MNQTTRCDFKWEKIKIDYLTFNLKNNIFYLCSPI